MKNYPLLLVTLFLAAAPTDALAMENPEPPMPVIEGFTPGSGPPGTTVNIIGKFLTGVTSVKFEGLEAASFNAFPEGTNILAVAPANAVSGSITVTAAGGVVTSAKFFRVIIQPPPSITGLSPASGNPGTTVTIEGTDFAGVSSVQFNGVEATFTFFADTLLATVPAGASTGPVRVTTSGGSAVSPQNFTVTQIPAPVIESISPLAGEPGVSVQVKGKNLTGVASVKVNGVEARFTTFVGILFVTIPPSATSGPITVTTGGGTATSGETFTVTNRGGPEISSITPPSGGPGASIRIDGQNLAGVTEVQFNGLTAEFTLFGGSIFATVPQNAVTGPITVAAPAGRATSPEPFTVTAAPGPLISGFSPSSGEAGASVEISGSNFSGAVSVRFNGVEAAFTNQIDGLIIAWVPAAAVTGPISVATPAGTNTSAASFTVVNPARAVLASVTPLEGPPGTEVFFRGDNLTPVSSIRFNGSDAVFVEFSSSLVMATVPAGAASGPISISTANGDLTSENFTVSQIQNPPEPPALSVRQKEPNLLEISWPQTTAMFDLFASDRLTGPAPVVWEKVDATPAAADGKNTLSIPTSGPLRFFRLQSR